MFIYINCPRILNIWFDLMKFDYYIGELEWFSLFCATLFIGDVLA